MNITLTENMGLTPLYQLPLDEIVCIHPVKYGDKMINRVLHYIGPASKVPRIEMYSGNICEFNDFLADAIYNGFPTEVMLVYRKGW